MARANHPDLDTGRLATYIGSARTLEPVPDDSSDAGGVPALVREGERPTVERSPGRRLTSAPGVEP